jgi:hypothetical protein
LGGGLLRGKQSGKLAGIVQRMKVVTATDMRGSDEDLGDGSASGLLHHGLSKGWLKVDPKTNDFSDASGLQERLGASAERAQSRGVHANRAHDLACDLMGSPA